MSNNLLIWKVIFRTMCAALLIRVTATATGRFIRDARPFMPSRRAFPPHQRDDLAILRGPFRAARPPASSTTVLRFKVNYFTYYEDSGLRSDRG
jgi:hypothetical protein